VPFFAESYSLHDVGQQDSWFTDSNARQTRLWAGSESGEGARQLAELAVHDDDGLQREYYDVLSPQRRVCFLEKPAGGRKLGRCARGAVY
jgi:hypothetical protein